MQISPSSGVEVTIAEHGEGRPTLVLHGGGGPASVASLVDHLGTRARVLAPVLPGWDGTPRPDWFTGVDDLALALLDVLEDLNLRDVAVVGSSVGGWIGAEMAVRDQDAGRITGLVLVDAMGIDVPGQPIRDFFALSPHEIVDYSFADGDKFYVDPATLTAEQRTTQAANIATLRVYAGDPYMHDPKLARRLARVRLPALVIWGDADRIATPEYGRAYADAFTDAEFALIDDAGHLPHIERPDATFTVLDAYLDAQDA